MRFMLIILIPYLLLAAGFFFSLRSAFRSHAPSRILFLPSLVISALLTLGLITWGFVEIGALTSSTAPIGYLVLPYMALAGALMAFLLVLAIGVIGRFIAERVGEASPCLTSMPKLLAALVFLLATGWGVHHNIARSRLLDAAASEATDAATLQTLLATAIRSGDLELQAELASNPGTPVPDLARLYDACKHSLDDPASPDYRLFHALAWNPQTPADILTALADAPFESVRYALASNPSTPSDVLEGMMDEEDSLIRFSLSENPNFPDDLRPQLNATAIENVDSPAE